MKEPWIIHRQSVHRYLPRFSALSINPHELSMTIPLFFHNRRVSSFCESHFFSPFWWRSFRRFCPLVICTETASRFERGPKHVAQRWGIEADGFVGNANKTSKPHTEMCKTTHLFQSVLLHKCFFFFVACFCGCKKKIPTWNAISQEQEYQKKMFWSRILLRHTFPFQRISADSVRWLGTWLNGTVS